MKHNICDVKIGNSQYETCGKLAFEQVAIRKNYWLGEKIVKIDVCSEHFLALLKTIGFESEDEANRGYRNQWRKSND